MKIFGSKKATMTAYGLIGILLIVVVVKLAIPDIDDETLASLITLLGGIIGTYNIGQGIADHGKDRQPQVIFRDAEE